MLTASAPMICHCQLDDGIDSMTQKEQATSKIARGLEAGLNRWLQRADPFVGSQFPQLSKRLAEALLEGKTHVDLQDSQANAEAHAPAYYQLPKLAQWEQWLGHWVLKRVGRHFTVPSQIDEAQWIEIRRHLEKRGRTPQQIEAIGNAITAQFSLITGGPGTGKSTIIADIAQIFAEFSRISGDELILLAPSGRAAARLRSIEVDAFEEAPALQLQTATLHRLLGFWLSDRRSVKMRIAKLRLVIVDESSMLDLSMLYLLLSQLHPACQVVLVGDADQLPPINLGQPFADLCQLSSLVSLPMVRLTKSHRHQGQIMELAHTVEQAISSEPVVRHLEANLHPKHVGGHPPSPPSEGHPPVRRSNLSFIDLGHPSATDIWQDSLVKDALKMSQVSLPSPLNSDVLESRLKHSIILASQHEGPLGIDRLNLLIQHRVLKAKCADVGRLRGQLVGGTPVMVTQNLHHLGVYNGDIGLILGEADVLGAFAAFVCQGEVRVLPIAQLRQPQIAYAITVHKSQGSEFDRVHCVMDRIPQHLPGKALLYTALTRAKRQLYFYSSRPVIDELFEDRSDGLSSFLQLVQSQISNFNG